MPLHSNVLLGHCSPCWRSRAEGRPCSVPPATARTTAWRRRARRPKSLRLARVRKWSRQYGRRLALFARWLGRAAAEQLRQVFENSGATATRSDRVTSVFNRVTPRNVTLRSMLWLQQHACLRQQDAINQGPLAPSVLGSQHSSRKSIQMLKVHAAQCVMGAPPQKGARRTCSCGRAASANHHSQQAAARRTHGRPHQPPCAPVTMSKTVAAANTRNRLPPMYCALRSLM